MNRKELKDLVVNIARARGDAIAGEKVIAQARDVGKPLVVPGTSSHRIQEVILRTNVLCVIDQPFRLREAALKLKPPPA